MTEKNWIDISNQIVAAVEDWLLEYSERILENDERFSGSTYKEDAEWLLETIKHISPDYAVTQILQVSQPQEMHQFFLKAKLCHVEMMIDGEKYIYIQTSEDEFQLFRDGDCPRFYVVPGSAADTPEETWGTSPGYSEASGIWD